MKFTIYGFSQEKLIEYGLDSVDALILRYFIDFKDTGEMVLEIVDNKPYYWLKYAKLIKEIPIVSIRSKDALRRRLKKLEDSKILDHFYKKQGGSYSFYGIGENYKYLVKRVEGATEKSEGTTQKSEGYDSKVGEGTTQKSEQKIHLSKDSSIKDKCEYADYVFMTKDEYKKLIEKYGENNVKLMVGKLDNYKGSNGKQYKCDYRAILSWVADEVMKKVKTEKIPNSNSYKVAGEGECHVCKGKGVVKDLDTNRWIECPECKGVKKVG